MPGGAAGTTGADGAVAVAFGSKNPPGVLLVGVGGPPSQSRSPDSSPGVGVTGRIGGRGVGEGNSTSARSGVTEGQGV